MAAVLVRTIIPMQKAVTTFSQGRLWSHLWQKTQVGRVKGGAGMAQWWERSPPTNVSRVRFPDPASYVVEFVVYSLPCSERFFSGHSGFPLSSKTNVSKFQFDLEYCQALYHEPLARLIAQALPVFDTKFTFKFLQTSIVKVVLWSKKHFLFFFRFWKRIRLTSNWQNFELCVLSEGCLFWV